MQILIHIVSVIILCTSTVTGQTAAECSALSDLYNYTTGATWFTPWPSQPNRVSCTPACSTPYHGVVCSGGHVTQLNLGGNVYTPGGTIPPSIGNLTSLTVLDLSDNYLTGSIPSTIGNLVHLTKIDFSTNSLTGSIPPTVGSLLSLQQLLLGWNSLTGPIPSGIGYISTLQYLTLVSNQLNGPIPASFGNLTAGMVSINVESNQLTGSIPPSITNARNLNYLMLDGNHLSGQIPSTMDSCAFKFLSICILSSGNSLCHFAGQTFPSACSSDLSSIPLCTNTTATSTGTSATPSTGTSATTSFSNIPATTSFSNIPATSTSTITGLTSAPQALSATQVGMSSTLIIAIVVPGTLAVIGAIFALLWMRHRFSHRNSEKPQDMTRLTANLPSPSYSYLSHDEKGNTKNTVDRTAATSTSTAALLYSPPVSVMSSPSSMHYSTQMAIMTTMMDTSMRQGTWFALPGHLLLESGRDIRVLADLAKGGGGDIKVAELLNGAIATKGKIVVFKLLNTDEDLNFVKAVWQQEISILWAFKDHENIAKLIGYTEDPLGIILHRYETSLQNLILGNVKFEMTHPLNSEEALGIAIGIANGMKSLHDAFVLHLDLKSANVLIDVSLNGSYIPAITDFGISQIVGAEFVAGRLKSKAHGISIHYASPEAIRLFRGGTLTGEGTPRRETTMDCYSFAIILYELLELKFPWAGLHIPDICTRVLEGDRPPISSHVEDSKDESARVMLAVMKRAWSQNPLDRPSFQQMKEMLMKS